MTELCGLRVSVETYITLKGPLQCKHCQQCDTVVTHAGVLLLVRLTSQGSALPHSSICEGNLTANYQGCVKWKEAKAALAKRLPVECN